MSVGLRKRALAWVKHEPFGVEFAAVDLWPRYLRAEGVAIMGRPVVYRLDYALETGSDFVTSRLYVSSRGESWRRALDLRRDKAGVWGVAAEQEGEVDLPPPGGDSTALADALDCDLGLSPMTNLMPILRHDLLSGGGPIELTAAWVSVPDLSVQPDRQRYTFLRSGTKNHVIRYEATDGTFAADITVDPDGVVLDYPGIARRLSASDALT
jgi:hypothetical protein